MSVTPVVYDSANIFLETRTTVLAKITSLDAIIDALLAAALAGASTGNFEEYQLDDGQVRIRTTYRNVTDVTEAITGFERVRQHYINCVNGRRMWLVDGSNMRGPSNGR